MDYIVQTRATRFHVVGAAVDRDVEPVRTFQSFTGALHRMADWLQEVSITTVTMGIDRRLLDPGLRDAGRARL